MNAVGTTSKLFPLLLPAGLLFVKDLDITTLETKLKGYNGIGRNAIVEFRVPPSGRFDAVLVAVGRANETADRFLLALEDDLPIRDQLALYAHAVGHLLLNYQERQTGRIPTLDPADLYAHVDTLTELRTLSTLRSAADLDRRVLDAYPLLAQLVEVPEESKADLNAATAGLGQLLNRTGWRTPYLVIQYQLTPGRIYPNSARRGRRHIADAFLRAGPSLPIAVVRTQRAGETRDISINILLDYARRMALPFAYLLDEYGSIHEFDWTSSLEPITTKLDAFPDRDMLLDRWLKVLQLTDERARKVLLQPYGGSGKFPRYYQEAAINQAVIAVLQARRGMRSPRILLTMATGTGKTPVAFQILWKLKKARPFEIRNVLFLTDRDFLVDQAMNEFDPFGAALDRGKGEPSAVHDVKFYTYQGITATDDQGHPRYRFYPSNFFDVVVVDECHRGSAQEASNWREVLKHFSGEVSHEAVIREWPRLAGWLREARDDLPLQQAISEDAAEWRRHGKPGDRLYRGSQLREAQAWARHNTPSGNEVAFLRASTAYSMRSLVSVIAVLLLVVSSTGIAGWFYLHRTPDPTHVTNLNDDGPGSLRWDIENAPSGSTITFDPSLRGTILLSSGNLNIGKNLKILSPGAGILSISSGKHGQAIRVVYGMTVTISGLTFKDSTIFNDSFIDNVGTLTLSNSTVSGNTANSGGGIVVSDRIFGGVNPVQVMLLYCTVYGNTANVGGGIWVDNVNKKSQVTIGASIVAGNSAHTSPDIVGLLTSLGYNLIGDRSSATSFKQQPTDVLGVPLTDLKIDPMLRDNGGSVQPHTWTHALL